MKRYGNLYGKVIDMDNIRLAAERAVRGKGSRPETLAFMERYEENLAAIHAMLRDGTYRVSPYREFVVERPKRRVIRSLPLFPDKVIQHAVMNVAGPIWRRTFTHNTYSCLKGRGIHACAERLRRDIRSFDGRPLHCLKLDVRQFYASIDHGVMKRIVRRKIKDKRLLALLDMVIDSTPGLAIGNYLSQYLSNLCLAYLMHHLNEVLRVRAVEYADDIIVLAEGKDTLWHVLDYVRQAMDGLGLRLKDDWQVFPVARDRRDRHGRGIDFIGYVFYRECTLLRKRVKRNVCRKAARLNKREGVSLHDYKVAIAPWLGWLRHCDGRNLERKIIKTEYHEDIIGKRARRH